MSTAKKLNLISVEDYLAGELMSPVKHEYLGGIVHAMAGALNAHNRIATKTVVALGSRLRGRRCEVFNSDTKIRIHLPRQIRFYYPDASVICNQNPLTDSFQDEPAVLFEVLSRGTRRIDTGEKLDAYLTIPSLAAYVLIEQDGPAVVVHRRSENGFEREVYQGLDAVISLPEIEIELPLVEIYQGVEFAAEPDDDEEANGQ
jgi:Uma2 family endonuclease